jgi:hypothetical protein
MPGLGVVETAVGRACVRVVRERVVRAVAAGVVGAGAGDGGGALAPAAGAVAGGVRVDDARLDPDPPQPAASSVARRTARPLTFAG